MAIKFSPVFAAASLSQRSGEQLPVAAHTPRQDGEQPLSQRLPNVTARVRESRSALLLANETKQRILDICLDLEKVAFANLTDCSQLDLSQLRHQALDRFAEQNPQVSKSTLLLLKLYLQNKYRTHAQLSFSLKDGMGELPKDSKTRGKLKVDGTLLHLPGKLILLEDPQVHAPLGKGAGGEVVIGHDLSIDDNDPRLAVKLMKLGQNYAGKMNRNELDFLPKLPNSRRLLKPVATAEFADHAYQVMEFAPYGDGFALATLINKARSRVKGDALESFIRTAATWVIQAAGDMHRANRAHGDFKLENLVLGEDGLKLADFGRSKVSALQIRKTNCEYTAYNDRWTNTKPRSDIREEMFSVGMTLYALATGVQIAERHLYEIDSMRLDGSTRIKGETLVEVAAIQMQDDPGKRKSSQALLDLPYFKNQELLSPEAFISKREALLAVLASHRAGTDAIDRTA